MYEDSLFSTSSPTFVICGLFDGSYSNKCQVISHCGFNSHFSDAKSLYFDMIAYRNFLILTKIIFTFIILKCHLFLICQVHIKICFEILTGIKIKCIDHLGKQSHFLKKKIIYYLYLVALGLHCCARAPSSCGEQGSLFVAVHGLSLVAVSGGHSSLRCTGFSL